jgi:hypothetical protein
VLVTRGVNATTRDPCVAAEGGVHPRLLAILGRTGRDIAMLSAHPGDREVVLLPGTVLRPVGHVDVEPEGVAVDVLEEIDVAAAAQPGPGRGDRAVTFAAIRDDVRAAWGRCDASVVAHARGKFAGPLT